MKQLELFIEIAEIALDSLRVLIKNGSYYGGVALRDVRLPVGKELPDGFHFVARLAFIEDCISCFADAAIRYMQREFAIARTLKQLDSRWTLVMCRGGVSKYPVALYENVRHR